MTKQFSGLVTVTNLDVGSTPEGDPVQTTLVFDTRGGQEVMTWTEGQEAPPNFNLNSLTQVERGEEETMEVKLTFRQLLVSVALPSDDEAAELERLMGALHALNAA